MENKDKTKEETMEVVEETKAEETEKKKFTLSKTAKIIICGVIATIVVAYVGVAMYFSEKFLPGTTVNGIACAGKTLEQVETMMQKEVEEYILTLEEAGNVTEQIQGTDIAVKYNGADTIQEALENQNSFAWIAALFHESKVEAAIDFVYDEEKLAEIIGNLSCLKEENQIASVDAVPVYADGTFNIQEETYGTVIDQEQFNKIIREKIERMEEHMNLGEENCYVLPKYTKDSAEIIAAKDALNQCLKAKITYSLDSITMTLDSSKTYEWLSVDENMNVVISAEKVEEFAKSVASTYNTKPRAAQITTPTGKVANVGGAALGRIIGTSAECDQITKEIKEGKVITREPIITQHATPEGQYSWGTTYTEVDLSTQHMWYISNGQVVFETDVVTGSPGRDTPAGVFKILEKKRNKTLVGNIVPETGKPEYETPVSYWARVTWSGIGFHDATWQPAFGGQLYKQGYGSHGCINMPLGAVASFYDMVSVGCPVIIHY